METIEYKPSEDGLSIIRIMTVVKDNGNTVVYTDTISADVMQSIKDETRKQIDSMTKELDNGVAVLSTVKDNLAKKIK
jgi:hypothetical protein